MADKKYLHSPNIEIEYDKYKQYATTPSASLQKDKEPTKFQEHTSSFDHGYDISQIANIEKKINQTLNSFEVERNKQEMEVKKIKAEVDLMDKCQSSYRQIIDDTKYKEREKPNISEKYDAYPSTNVDYSIGIIQGLQREKKEMIEKYEVLKKSKKDLKILYDSLESESKEQLKNNEYKIRELERDLSITKEKLDEQDRYILESNDVRAQLHNAESRLLEERAISKQTIQRLTDELDANNQKLHEKVNEEQNQLLIVSKILTDLLTESSKNCDFLSNINFAILSVPQKLSNLEKLVRYLFCEKEYSEKKYSKLMELHNEAVELNNKVSNKFNPDSFKKLNEENNDLRKQIGYIKEQYEYDAY